MRRPQAELTLESPIAGGYSLFTDLSSLSTLADALYGSNEKTQG